MNALVGDAKRDGTSLAVFKPTKLIKLEAKKEKREWDEKIVASIKAEAQQMQLFKSEREVEKEYRLLNKIPYNFFYNFGDNSGKTSRMKIMDWEIGMLFLKCMKSANNDETIAIEKVRQKYFGEFKKKDLHLFLGTTKEHHNTAPNPFTIIGVFAPPMPEEELQLPLFK